MIWIRGNPLDYERWAKEPGLDIWDFAHCLPYFRRLENRLAGSNAYHGDSDTIFDDPLRVTILCLMRFSTLCKLVILVSMMSTGTSKKDFQASIAPHTKGVDGAQPAATIIRSNIAQISR